MDPRNIEILVEFGHRLREARSKIGLSQEGLAEIAGLDRTYISLIERGLRNPSLICIGKLADALEVPTSELLIRYKEKQ